MTSKKKSKSVKERSESTGKSCRDTPASFDPTFKAKQKAALARSEAITQKMQQESEERHQKKAKRQD